MFHHGSILTESDKLPWPVPYENAEKQFKWKIVRPIVSAKRNQIGANNSADFTSDNMAYGIETTSNATLPASPVTVPLNAYPSLTTTHPYEFESIHSLPNIFPMPNAPTSELSTLQPFEVYAQPVDPPNDTKYGNTHGNGALIPVDRINKEYA